MKQTQKMSKTTIAETNFFSFMQLERKKERKKNDFTIEDSLYSYDKKKGEESALYSIIPGAFFFFPRHQKPHTCT